mgnify:CR=1 FL=1
MGEQKKLEPDSEYSAMDLDNDGVVSDKEVIGAYMGMTAYMSAKK